METKRLFDVADKRLAESPYLAGDAISIADFATFPWLGALYRGLAYNEAKTFLSLDEYVHVGRWVMELNSRPATRRGLVVNRPQGEEGRILLERHAASDFDKLLPGTI